MLLQIDILLTRVDGQHWFPSYLLAKTSYTVGVMMTVEKSIMTCLLDGMIAQQLIIAWLINYSANKVFSVCTNFYFLLQT